MARYRRKRTGGRVVLGLLLLAAFATGAWWLFEGADRSGPSDTRLAVSKMPTLTTNRPEVEPSVDPSGGVIERGDDPEDNATTAALPPSARAEQLLVAGKQALAKKNWVSARELLSEAMDLGVDKHEQIQLRADLTRIGNETIFSPRTLANDPFVERYIVKAGDTLSGIAKKHVVSADFLASINGLRDKNMIRVGQTLKVVHGPFHAAIHKDTYTVDVYLGEGTARTFVKRYRVGLGEDGSTPTGMWRVKTKLKTPTYYPPRGGRIITADDPKNPLGERWIGLEGISGDAAGQQRYGIHGTIDPQSIGNSASLGCIRLYNEDVEALFEYLVVGHSTVVIE